MKRLLLFITLIIGLSYQALPTKAQSYFVVTFDSGGYTNYVMQLGTEQSGVGNPNDAARATRSACTFCENTVRVRINFSPAITLTSVTADTYVNLLSPLSGTYSVRAYNVSNTLLYDSTVGFSQTTNWAQRSLSMSVSNVSYLLIYNAFGTAGTSYSFDNRLDNIYINTIPLTNWVKPLANADLEEPLFNIAETYTLAKSDNAFDSVYSPFAGYVTQVLAMNVEACDFYYGGDGCLWLSNTYGYFYNSQGVLYDDTFQDYIYTVVMVQEVTAATVAYTVFSPNVSVGTLITAGCRLGTAPPEILTGGGMVLTNADEDKYTVDASGTTDCGVADGGGGGEQPPTPPANPLPSFVTNVCLNNDALLTSLSYWQTTNVNELSEGMQFKSGGFIKQTLNLESTREPAVLVYGAAESGTAQLFTQLGTSNSIVDFGTAADYKTTIEGDNHAADNSTFYTLSLKNVSSSGDMLIYYVCVYYTKTSGGGTETPPANGAPTCYLQNYSFNFLADNWTTSGTVKFIPGAAKLASGGSVLQDITLEAGDYTIIYSLGLYDDYQAGTSGGSLAIRSQVGASTFDQTTNTTLDQFAYNNVVKISVSMNIATNTTATFKTTATLTTPDTGITGTIIDHICIYQTDTDNPAPFPEDCQTIVKPESSDVPQWIDWQWRSLNSYYDCTLMVLLNKQYAFLWDAWEVTTYWIRWQMMAFTEAVNWFATEWTPYIAGYLSNVVPGTVVINEAEPTTCDWFNILCFLQPIVDSIAGLVDSISGLIDALVGAGTSALELINRFIDLAFSVIDLARELFDSGLLLIYGVFTGYVNAEPITPDGFPDCAYAPMESPACALWYTAENTVLGGTIGVFIIPMMVAVGYIVLAITAFGEFADMFRAIVNAVSGDD